MLVSPVVPEGEGVGYPLSMRYPKGLLKRIDKVAKETGNTRTDTILHMLRWALAEVDRQRAEEAKLKGSS